MTELDCCANENKPLLSVEEALTKIRVTIKAVEAAEWVSLTTALGRVLAEDIISPIDMPFDRNAAMDGYALSSADISPNQSFSLTLIGTSWAGKPFLGKICSGQCVRIFTGAVVPEGADSVVIQELVSVEANTVLFPKGVISWENIRDAGEDVKQGTVICAKQKKLIAADIGLIASVGISQIRVIRKINIAYFSTGDELVKLDQPLNIGKIYDSNRYLLAALLNDPRYQTNDMGILVDDKKVLESAIQQAAKTHDAIITTGGASTGDADYIKDVLNRCGQVNFWKIAIKPGKPLAFGTIGDCYFFGLPGNPISVQVTFQQIVTPALKQLSGAVMNEQPLRFSATCLTTFKKGKGRQEFLRGILSQDGTGKFTVTSSGKQGSNIQSAMSKANCYIVLPPESTGIEAGEQVLVEPFALSTRTF